MVIVEFFFLIYIELFITHNKIKIINYLFIKFLPIEDEILLFSLMSPLNYFFFCNIYFYVLSNKIYNYRYVFAVILDENIS